MDLSYVKQSGEANGDAGDPYTGLDRFGRIVDQRWVVASTGVATDRFQYGYDRDSNRTYRDNLVNSALGELYGYDDLGQLTSFQRGTLNGTKDGLTGTASRSQSWSLDAAGNFNSVTTDGTAQARTTDRQNEVTSVGGTSLTYDANGNLLTDDAGRQLSYDAWGRLVRVKDSAGNPIVNYAYDALGRRVSETKAGVTREFYYSADWQVLEEAVNGQVDTRYVWSPVYTDALILRDRDTNGDGTLDERLWVQQDANFNVTALVNSSGQVVERYDYDPFGLASVLNPDGTAKAGGSGYDWKYLHQGLRYDGGTGLYDDRGRPYSPTLARFIQRDPLGLGPDINPYRYEGDGPTGGLDPSGLFDEKAMLEYVKFLDPEVYKVWSSWNTRIVQRGRGLRLFSTSSDYADGTTIINMPARWDEAYAAKAFISEVRSVWGADIQAFNADTPEGQAAFRQYFLKEAAGTTAIGARGVMSFYSLQLKGIDWVLILDDNHGDINATQAAGLASRVLPFINGSKVIVQGNSGKTYISSLRMGLQPCARHFPNVVKDDFAKLAGYIPKREGYFDLYIHSSNRGISLAQKGADGAVEVADMLTVEKTLRAAGWDGKQAIRLVSCRAGDPALGKQAAAYKMSEFFGVKVLAPTEDIVLFEGGAYTITNKTRNIKPQTMSTGTWREFGK